LKSDGSLAAWGRNDEGQTNVPAGNDFVAIAAGTNHGLAIRQVVPEPANIALLAFCAPLLLVRNSRRSRAGRLHVGRRCVLTATARTGYARLPDPARISNERSRMARAVQKNSWVATAIAALLLNVAGSARADWLIKSYASPNAIVNYTTADVLIAGAGLAPGFPVSSQYPLTHVQDNDGEFTNVGLGAQIFGLPGAPTDSDNFAFVGQGALTVDVSGEYAFGTATDDGSRLRININGGPTQQIITDDVLSAMHIVRSAPLTLSAGDTVAFDWMWFERRGGAEGVLFYSRDSFDAVIGDSSLGLSLSEGNFTGTVYDAQYQTIRSFSDADVVKNTPGSERGSALRNVFNILDDPATFDGDFGGGEHPPGIPPPPFTEDYMAQGTGWLVVRPEQAGEYVFRSHSDDGSRLRIDLNVDGDFDDDGELAIYDDVNEPPHGANSELVALPAGRYPIEYSFFNGIFSGEGEISAALMGGGPERFFLLGDEASGGLDIVPVPEFATCFYLLVALLIRAPYRHRAM